MDSRPYEDRVEILKASEKLIEEGFDFKLNIVSQLKKGEWKDEHITPADIEKSKERIQRNNKVITHYYSLPSEEIMNLFSELNKEGVAIIQVTHSEKNAAYGTRVINLLDGRIEN